MERTYFIKTDRIGFSKWNRDDIELARTLWGNPDVTKFICASGHFSEEDIQERLAVEIGNEDKYQVQYWPIFELNSNEFIGCCGLRPYKKNQYEMGFHLLPEYWGEKFATEAANAVIDYAFRHFHAEGLFAGHNPKNAASRKVLLNLGLLYISDEFYAPTGLYHPSYELKKP